MVIVASSEDLGVAARQALPTWGDIEGVVLVCREVQRLTPDVSTFLFEPSSPALFAHEAGQFLTLELEIDGRPVSRCYTISTPPTRPYLIGITVKRQPGGLVSNWLHDTVRPGTQLAADGPYGSFTLGSSALSPAGGGKYLFLSGGSGATPLMAMTRTAFDLARGDDIRYVHSARTPDDILFRRELDLMASLAPGIDVSYVCERDAPGERWGGLRGLLSVDLIRVAVPDLHDREVYCCGPAPYMAAVRGILRELGFDMQRYHEESFTFEQLPEAERLAVLAAETDTVGAGLADGVFADGVLDGGGLVDEAAVTTYTVSFARSGTTIPCRSDEKILDAAYAAGLAPASSCGQGMCGTCKTTMLSGTVDMQHQGGIRPREVAQQKMLLCCSTPTSDVTLDA